MIIDLDENYLCQCDSDIIGYTGETNSRIIEFRGLLTDDADNYFMRFEYHDGKAYDAEIVEEKYEIDGSILREAKLVSCQIIASKRVGEEYKVVRKSNVFQLKICKSLDGTPTAIPTYEQSESALEKVLEAETNAKSYALAAKLSETSAANSSENATASANSAAASEISAANSALSCAYRDDLISNIMQMPITNFIMLKSKAGTFDVTVSGFTNPVWEYNSTKISGNNGVFTILQDGDFVKLSWDSAANTVLTVNANGKATAIFDLANLYGKMTSGIFCNDTSITGDLADLCGKLTTNLYCNNTAVHGDISALQGKLSTTLYCGNTNIYGDLSTLCGKINYALLCANTGVFGIYAPTIAVPSSTNLSATKIATADMDSTLIAYATKATELSKSNGTFTAAGMTRTAASDDAVATLVGAGWTVSGLIKTGV